MIPFVTQAQHTHEVAPTQSREDSLGRLATISRYGGDAHSTHPLIINTLIQNGRLSLWNADTVWVEGELASIMYRLDEASPKKFPWDSILVNYYNSGDSMVSVVYSNLDDKPEPTYNYYYRTGGQLRRCTSKTSKAIFYYQYGLAGKFYKTWHDEGKDGVIDSYTQSTYCLSGTHYSVAYELDEKGNKKFVKTHFFDLNNSMVNSLDHVPDHPCGGKYYK